MGQTPSSDVGQALRSDDNWRAGLTAFVEQVPVLEASTERRHLCSCGDGGVATAILRRLCVRQDDASDTLLLLAALFRLLTGRKVRAGRHLESHTACSSC
jgi:hypothetical protein